MNPAVDAPGRTVVQRAQFDVARLLALHEADPRHYPVLLESTSPGGTLGRFTILMAFPGERLDLFAGGNLQGNAPVALNQRFLSALDQWWDANRLPYDPSPLPFTGGWFLYLGYELAGEIEPSLHTEAEANVPVATAIRIPAAFILDHANGDSWLVSEPGRESLLATMEHDLRTERHVAAGVYSGPIVSGRVREEVPGRFLESVHAALAHIGAGDLYQANLSRAWRAAAAPGVKPQAIYRRLRLANPAPFAGCADLGSVAIISSSPERLVAVRGRHISTRPIAGTRPRSDSVLADRGLVRELRQHPKEQAEHVMLIDLERNDLGRVCEAGTVEVSEFMSVESYAHVHHIVSTVEGTLRAGITPGQCIAAVFPGGTITGCPKIRCMQVIHDLERAPRGVYTGSMGYLNRDGSLDLNILIRTVSMSGTELVFRAGAGIVADSDPERELEETRAKARGLLAALEPMEGSR